jgi:hypothetical protein
LLSTTSRSAVLACLLAVGACARPSPQLPPDLSHIPAEQRLLAGDAESAEGKLDCAGLVAERERNREAASKLEAAIAANRGHNQAIGYFSAVVFPPLLFAVRPDDDSKKVLDELQVQRDRIDRLSKAKRC